jgi:hypothetical protein
MGAALELQHRAAQGETATTEAERRCRAAAIGALSLAGLLQEIELAGRQGSVDRARCAFPRLGAEVGAVVRYLDEHREPAHQG